jgi:hypothetical protein
MEVKTQLTTQEDQKHHFEEEIKSVGAKIVEKEEEKAKYDDQLFIVDGAIEWRMKDQK